MANANKIILLGRLTREVELRYTQGGTAVADLGLAVNRKYRSNDQDHEETLFIDVTVWSATAEACAKYLAKGSTVYVEGHLSLESWEGQDGQKRNKIKGVAENVQFLDFKKTDGQGDARPPEAGGNTARAPSAPAPANRPPSSEEEWEEPLPF